MCGGSWGGFLKFFKGISDKRKLLTNYYEDIIYRDIADRYDVPPNRIREIANFLITNISNLISHRNIRNSLGRGLETISHYILWLEDAYLLFCLPFFLIQLRNSKQDLKRNTD
jgi:predicted AAA+ superfamily ATPase